MGGRERSSLLIPAGLLALLVFSLFVPQVAASGGLVTIDESTISLSASEQLEGASLTFTFDVAEASGQSADVTASSTLKTIGGEVLDWVNESKTIPMNAVDTFTVTFNSIPYGYSIVETTLTGDTGPENGNDVLSFNRTIQRLVPLDISLGASGDVLFNSLDSNGVETGNLTISDGDRVGVQIPVLNNGDHPWSGHMTVNITSGEAGEFLSVADVQVSAMSSTLVFVNSTIAMTEGDWDVTLALNATGDSDESDETMTVPFIVGPPPLPVINLDGTVLTTEYNAGDVIDWNLTVGNTGTRMFSGTILCEFGESTVLNQTLNLDTAASTTLTFTTQARPAELNCSALGMRISDLSNTPFTEAFNVVSAQFEAAGSQIPGVLDGPWHVGDSARFSMLVRNHGDRVGEVALECTTSQSVYTSPMLSLDLNAAGEVSVVVPMLVMGDESIAWRLVSPDGSIDEGLNGTITVPVAAKQSLIPSVDAVTWDAEKGVEMEWSVTLTEGVDRPVRIRLGYFDSGETYVLDYVINLEPGVVNGQLELGFIDADSVTLRADAIDWSEAVGPSSDSKSIPDARPVYELTFNPVSSPSRPAAGQNTEIEVTIDNTGDADGLAGEILLLSDDSTLLATTTTPVLGAGETSVIIITIESWPEGTRVTLEAKWIFGGSQVVGSESYISSEVEAEAEEFEVPWLALFGGVCLAGAIVAGVRIQQAQSLKPSRKRDKVRPSKSKSKGGSKDTKNIEKIQIGCPECARQLRVPATYSGSVRCPDCSNRFDVEGRSEDVEEAEEDEVEEVVDEAVAEQSDKKVEVSCPECAQSLRVPSDYSGSVRCPACEHVFKAKG